MPDDTEEMADDYLAEEAEREPSAESEERSSPEWGEGEETGAPEAQAAALPGLEAVLEHKGGEARDWELEYRGDSGYRFDGEMVRDPEGGVWTNEDTALHQEMLAQWQEGGSAVFFLPDYRERTEEAETLYVTQLMLDEEGRVTYEIYKHEIACPKEEEAGAKAGERSEMRGAPAYAWDARFSEGKKGERMADALPGAERAQEALVQKEAEEEFPEPGIASESAEKMSTILDERRGAEFLAEKTGGTVQGAADAWLLSLLQKDRLGMPSGPKAETTAARQENPVSLHTAEELLRALGMPLPSPEGPFSPALARVSLPATSRIPGMPPWHLGQAQSRRSALRVSGDGVIMELAA